MALSRWPEEPAGGRRQEEKKGSPALRPTRPLPGLREQLRGVCACVAGLCALHGPLEMRCGCVTPGGTRALGATPPISAPTAAPGVSLTPPPCAGCSAGKNKPRCMASRANVHSLSGVLHPIRAFPYRAARSKHPRGPRTILPAGSSASCGIYPSPPSLSHGDTASAPSPALQKATPRRGHAVFIRNKTRRAGLLWQVCSKYRLQREGHRGSGDYTLLPRESLPSPGQALPQPHKRCQGMGAV